MAGINKKKAETIKIKVEDGHSSSSIYTPDNLGTRNSFSNLEIGKLKSISRLPSFRSPRDLTLTSTSSAPTFQPQVSRVKKTVVPNIPQRRDKVEKSFDSKSAKSFKQPKLSQSEHGKGKERGKEKVFVQSKGALFGDGVAASARRQRPSVGSFGNREKKQSDVQKPTLPAFTEPNLDKDAEEKCLKELLRDDFIDDPDEDVKFTKPAPIVLPLAGTQKSDTKPPSGVKVKREPGICDDDKSQACDTLVSGAQDIPTVAEIFNKQDIRDFLFFQMPTSLPAFPPESGGQDPQRCGQSEASNKNNQSKGDDEENPNLCSFSNLPDGHIGTLNIHASGKVSISLGDHTLSVKTGADFGFLQKVVMTDSDSESRSGTMTVLGKIGHRLVCTPEFGSLIDPLKRMS